MVTHPGSIWLYDHWNSDDLPNNRWVAASANGILAQNEDLDVVLKEVGDVDLRTVTFAFITFDLWQ